MTAAEHADLIMERAMLERAASLLENRALALDDAADRASGADAEMKRRNARHWWACAVDLRRELQTIVVTPAAIGIAAE